ILLGSHLLFFLRYVSARTFIVVASSSHIVFRQSLCVPLIMNYQSVLYLKAYQVVFSCGLKWRCKYSSIYSLLTLFLIAASSEMKPVRGMSLLPGCSSRI
uniref:Secreted protein n=1 Tax=Parascaris univalens TaxID=6257 RepID=A0A915BD18_PARUN